MEVFINKGATDMDGREKVDSIFNKTYTGDKLYGYPYVSTVSANQEDWKYFQKTIRTEQNNSFWEETHFYLTARRGTNYLMDFVIDDIQLRPNACVQLPVKPTTTRSTTTLDPLKVLPTKVYYEDWKLRHGHLRAGVVIAQILYRTNQLSTFLDD